MPARRTRRKRPTIRKRRKRQQGGFLPGFGVAKGVTNLAGKLVKDKGAKQALTESLGTKLKRAWYGITGQHRKRIDREMRKKGFARMR